MIVSGAWLRDYVTPTMDMEQLAERLTMVGLEVEAVEKPYAYLETVVVGRITAVEAHPKADRLKICRVQDGREERRVVCGAPNVAVGQHVPLALPGTVLPSGMEIQEATIRGELSRGMLCSQKELQLGDDASGIWVLPEDTQVGLSLAEVLDLNDVRLDVSITPNRGDCLSMVGIAREVAAICGTSVRYPIIDVKETGPRIETLASVTLEDPMGCPRYAARLIEGVTVGASPSWMRRRLEFAGIRSINNIVDVTNYVLLELGQPLHAFDYDRLREGRIVVRRAVAGEKFITLDGVERTLFDDTLLICDGQGPVAIAGIMGGLESGITESTTRVLIESAYFQPECIRRSSRKLGLRTESSYRFERGVDPEGVLRAADRAAQLMLELAGGSIAQGRLDAYPVPVPRPRIRLRVSKVNRFLGMNLSAQQMADVLRSLEMDVTPVDAETLQVLPPSFRPDVTREVDLAEEVARLTGYDKVPVTHAQVPLYSDPVDPHAQTRGELKRLLEAAGYYEVLTFSFTSEKALRSLRLAEDDARLQPVRLLNPLSEEQAVMRTTLLPGLLQATRLNLDRGNLDVRLFELSKVFLPQQGELLPREDHHLAGIVVGRRDSQPIYGAEDAVDYTDVKGVVEEILAALHLEESQYSFTRNALPPYGDTRCCATLEVKGRGVGSLGRIHPDVQEAFDLKREAYYFELDFEALFALKNPHPGFTALPKFPSVVRDMALIVDASLPVADPLAFIRSLPEPLMESVSIFDLYRGKPLAEHQKGVGYRVVYRAADRNLTDEEVNAVHERITAQVLDRFQATLR
ncbi:phenylalanine--tRNA ligase subunit beta [Desulfosoma caldarium]|uniref:Phenylalanine--tRNA ligase beta subunit n=1 Tax=Desulfosoma caldarium TaxID=610254 RepID=A0A3N1VHQ6_9BACT|nr:phenylalanine--tRNA ligase subunit beta [Desulfosoma caldarium]ROR01549.1 phenylalanyl-tRNA synthetase beta subunit [Desulfosoma caldarium]